MLRTHDDWERLVAAVLKKQQLWELFHAHSRSPSVSSESSSSDVSRSSSFREIDTSSAYWQELEDAVAKLENPVLRKLVLVSDFSPSFDADDVDLASMELLGNGTFGSTYVGDVSNGVKIVVKRVNQSLILSDFKGSMDVVGRLRHQNVVPLRAYYCSQVERLMLYDYYGKGSVHQLLHRKTNTVGWQTRLTMAIGAARGLAFIHLQKLVHGNVKSSNVLLNKESYGCVSDHGIANLTSAELMKKSYCYAPEVKSSTKNVSQESDVYSFGILLFELLTRKSPVRFLGGPEAVDLVKLMKSVKSKQMTPKVFDAELLKDQNNREQMVKVLQIGISCVAKSPKKRPKMSDVSKMLEDLGASLPKGNGLVFVHRNNESTAEDPFDLEIMLRASAEVLGKGTFGTSYKASLETGLIVRVKRLKDGNVTSAKSQQHVERISRINHRYCATAMAYSFSKDEVLLVYDYYDEDSLSTLLHGTLDSRKPLPWETRLKIALTAAKGIHHIHSQDSSKLVVHGNVRSSNILLDRNGNAVITDVALHKVTKPIRRSALKQQGYIAPEVKDTRNVSQASDVYSFGVVLLELLTRKLPTITMGGDDAIYLVEWAQICVGEGNLDELFDAELVGDEQMFEALQLAMDCVADVAERRPRMSQVVGRLQEICGIYNDEEQSEPSIEYDSENPKPWIGMRLEDALEDLTSSLAFQQS